MRWKSCREGSSLISAQSESSCAYVLSCVRLYDPMACSPPGSSVHGDSPGKNAGVGCYSLLQRIFLTQGVTPVSCVFCIVGGSLLAEPSGGPYYGRKAATDWKPLSSQGLPAKTYFSYIVITSNIPNHPKSL